MSIEWLSGEEEAGLSGAGFVVLAARAAAAAAAAPAGSVYPATEQRVLGGLGLVSGAGRAAQAHNLKL